MKGEATEVEHCGTPQLRVGMATQQPGQVRKPEKPQRLDVLLTSDLVDWLDEQAAATKRKTGSKPNRSELLRFILETLRDAGDGPADWF